jgi:hypothetical protein
MTRRPLGAPRQQDHLRILGGFADPQRGQHAGLLLVDGGDAANGRTVVD